MSASIDPVQDLRPQSLARFDAIIDVRSPSEFAEDHLPGAINLPVLDDRERAEVGTIYVQTSRFLARRIGAAKVARNIARHLDEALAGRPPDFRPLLYCWRGGMRSGAMATVLGQVGWRCGVVAGGYKAWRRGVVEALRKSDERLPLLLLDGQTGAAKTELLGLIAARGVQTIDLEALARHRGSVFGAFPDAPQPSQKLFESMLWHALAGFDPSRPVVVEAESNRIGGLILPRRLWLSMISAARIDVTAPVDARAQHLVRTYADLIADPPRLHAAIDRLKPFHSSEALDEWRAHADAQRFDVLAAALIRAHYDPLYDRARRKRGDAPRADIRLPALSHDALNAAADEIARVAAAR